MQQDRSLPFGAIAPYLLLVALGYATAIAVYAAWLDSHAFWEWPLGNSIKKTFKKMPHKNDYPLRIRIVTVFWYHFITLQTNVHYKRLWPKIPPPVFAGHRQALVE